MSSSDSLYSACGPMERTFDSLLKNARSYSTLQAHSHLHFFRQNILPTVRPPAGTQRLRPLCTPNGSAVEPSVNFTSRGAIVRFVFEPLSLQGLDMRVEDIVARIGPLLDGASEADTRWFGQLAGAMVVSPAEAEAVLKTGQFPAYLDRVPAYYLAFDLVGEKRSPKGYVFPLAKAILTHRTPEQVVFEALRLLDPLGPELAPAAGVLEAFLRTSKTPCPVYMVSMDFLDPVSAKASGGGSRVKIYGRTATNAFAAVADILTLGGKLNNEDTLEGLRILKSIWHLLLDEPEGIFERGGRGEWWSKRTREERMRMMSVVFTFDLKPGNPLPEVRIAVPIWQYARTVDTAVANLERVFRMHGWEAAATGGFREMVRAAFPTADFESNGSNGPFTFVGFAYSKSKGVYMTTYLTPPVPDEGGSFPGSMVY